MRRTIMFVVFAGLVGASWGAPPATAEPQTRPGQFTQQPTPQRPADSGILRGVVIAGDTGGVLRRARVTLNAPGLREVRAATTDLEGRWEFKNLPAGRFTLVASKPQYVTLEYGQRIPTEPGRPIELGPGQVIERISFRLPRGSVVSGRITDDLGEPAAQLFVQALRLHYVNGRRQLGPVGTFARTDDLGQYRLAGLPPGNYHIGTSSTIWVSGSPEDVGISFGDTYYPGTLRAAEAQPVQVRLGQERPNVDFGVRAVKLAMLSGIVLDSQGTPVANSGLMLMQERQGPTGVSVVATGDIARTGSDGRFTVPNVAPGDYSISSNGTAPRFDLATERGSVSVTVAGEDIAGLTIQLHRGSRVTGQIEFEGDPLPSVSPSLRIYASDPAGSRGFSMPGTSTIHEDWSFEIAGVSPGSRLFRMAGLPDTHALKAVMLGDEDVIDTTTAFDGKEPIAGVRLVVTTRVTEIGGTVTDDRGRLVQDYAAIAFASDPDQWKPGTRRIATGRPDQNGRFSIKRLPPGDYLVAALPYLEYGDAEDPEFLASIKARATAVSLVEGEQKAVSLKVLSFDK